MAAEPKRKTAVAAVVTRLRTATGSNYFHDLSSAVVTSATHERQMALRESGLQFVVRVVEGTETYERKDLGNQFEARLEVGLELLRKWDGVGNVTDRLNELIADCRRVIESDPALAGATVEAVFTGCDPVEVDADETTAATTLRLVLVYDWVRGQSGAAGL